MKRARRIVPLSVLKANIDRRARLRILDRVEAQFTIQEVKYRNAQVMVEAHRAFLVELSLRADHLKLSDGTPKDYLQEFTDFFLARHGRSVEEIFKEITK